MALNVSESTAVLKVVDFLVHTPGRERKPTSSEVLEALVILTDSAYEKLAAGPRGDDVRRAWEKHRPTTAAVPKAGWGR